MKKLIKIQIIIMLIGFTTLLFPTTANAFYYPKIENQGTITITGVADTDQLIAFKIIDVYYNERENVITREFTSDFKSYLSTHPDYQDFTIDDYYQLTNGDITSGSTQTNSTLDKFCSDVLIAYRQYNEELPTFGTDMPVSNNEANLTAEVGAYVIVPYATQRVYAPMVANIDYVGENGEWVTKNAEIVAKVSDVSIDKTLGEYQYYNYETTIGKSYENNIQLKLPTYPTNATNKRYYITDTLSDGITFNGLNTIKLIIGIYEYNATSEGKIEDQNGNIIGTATFENQILTVELYDDYISSRTVNVIYKTELNENAIIGISGNPTNTTLTYSIDPYGFLLTSTDNIQVKTYTYGIQIYKYDLETEEPLSGAVFEIYADEELTDLVGTITTGEDGVGYYRGVDARSHYLVEIKAPTGYKLIQDSIYVDTAGPVSSSPETVNIERQEGHTLVYISNEKIQFLPSTGGIGTIVYTLTGTLIVIGSFIYIKKYKNNQNNLS